MYMLDQYKVQTVNPPNKIDTHICFSKKKKDKEKEANRKTAFLNALEIFAIKMRITVDNPPPLCCYICTHCLGSILFPNALSDTEGR